MFFAYDRLSIRKSWIFGLTFPMFRKISTTHSSLRFREDKPSDLRPQMTQDLNTFSKGYKIDRQPTWLEVVYKQARGSVLKTKYISAGSLV